MYVRFPALIQCDIQLISVPLASFSIANIASSSRIRKSRLLSQNLSITRVYLCVCVCACVCSSRSILVTNFVHCTELLIVADVLLIMPREKKVPIHLEEWRIVCRDNWKIDFHGISIGISISACFAPRYSMPCAIRSTFRRSWQMGKRSREYWTFIFVRCKL